MAIQTITLLLNIYDMFDLMKVIRGGDIEKRSLYGQ